MAQRRSVQRCCKTKGRRRKTTPCSLGGSFHDELGEILREASTRPSICAGTGLHVLPVIPSIVIYGVFFFFRLCLIPFLLCRRLCRSLAMFSAGSKLTPCLVTMAEEKRHEVLFE